MQSPQTQPKTRKLFIEKLFDVVSDPENSEILSWNEEGDGFIITDLQQFEAQILPVYFGDIRYNSFLRQLNMYYFEYVKDHDEGYKLFTNPQFLKGRQDLLRSIPHRTKDNRRRAKE